MRDLSGRTALVTGASRNIGACISRALAGQGMNLVLAARSAGELEAFAGELRAGGAAVAAVPTDVGDEPSLRALVAAAEERFGRVDVLVNNAGAIAAGAYHQLEPERIAEVLRVDLGAPMLLARLLLPGMLERGCGHIVNLSSLAGRFGLPGIETYCAAKAGLANFTSALRAAYRGSGVSASAILPGFVHGAGMYDRFQNATGLATPPMLGSSSPERVAGAVVRAILADLPEVVVNPRPIRPMLALQGLFPGVTERLVKTFGGDWYARAGRLYSDAGGATQDRR